MRAAALAGLQSEARCLRAGSGLDTAALTIAVSGAEAARARSAARELAAGHPSVLVSFGLAGGLDPALTPGALVVPAAVIMADGRALAAAPGWCAAIRQDLRFSPSEGDVAASGLPVTTAAAKARLYAASGAAIVDMESAAVAEAAVAAGIPFLVIRAVCDPATRSVPEALTQLIGPAGRLRPAGIPGLVAHLPAAVALARDSRRGLRSLRWAAAALGGCCQL